MLRQHEAFMWMDSSIRFDPCFPKHIAKMKRKLVRSGLVMLHPSRHSVYAVTMPSLYKFLPTNIRHFRKMRSYGGGAMIFARIRETVDAVIKWLTLCLLDEDCAMPQDRSLPCHGVKNHVYQSDYMWCHRFDMAILGILLANHFEFKQHMYAEYPERCFQVHRSSDMRVYVNQC